VSASSSFTAPASASRREWRGGTVSAFAAASASRREWRGGTVSAFAADVERVLERVGIGSLSILAWSAGAAYALAVTERLGNRVDAASFYGAIAPPSTGIPLDGMDPAARAMWQLATGSARLVRVQLTALCAGAHRDPVRLSRISHLGAPSCDRSALSEPATRAMYARAYRGGAAMGAEGLAQEMSLLARPWDLDLGAIDGRVLRFVYGELDRLTPIGIGRHIVKALPGSHLTEVPHAGHLLIWQRWQDAIREVLAHQDPGAEQRTRRFAESH
jgi:pimeloyl-ACP methyl ester carboxylesterase